MCTRAAFSCCSGVLLACAGPAVGRGGASLPFCLREKGGWPSVSLHCPKANVLQQGFAQCPCPGKGGSALPMSGPVLRGTFIQWAWALEWILSPFSYGTSHFCSFPYSCTPKLTPVPCASQSCSRVSYLWCSAHEHAASPAVGAVCCCQSPAPRLGVSHSLPLQYFTPILSPAPGWRFAVPGPCLPVLGTALLSTSMGRDCKGSHRGKRKQRLDLDKCCVACEFLVGRSHCWLWYGY